MTLTTEFLSAYLDRRILNSISIAPRLLSAIGSHVLNLRHRGYRLQYSGQVPIALKDPMLKPIYASASKVDLRANLLIVGEPATGKDLHLDQCFDDQVGFVHGTLPFYRAGRVTEAGLVGQKEQQADRTTKWVRGLFHEHQNSIVAFGEFAAVTDAMNSKHSKNLLNTMLEALDSGRVTTDIGSVHDQYYTRSTSIGGVQPQRFENISGFGRRFIYYRNPPPIGEMAIAYKRAKREHRSVELDVEKLKTVRQGFRDRFEAAQDIQRIRLSPAVSDRIINDANINNEMSDIIEKACIGYHFLDEERITSDLVVPDSQTIHHLIDELIGFHGQVTADPEVVEAIRENELSMTGLVSELVKSRVCSSRNKAERAVRNVLQHYQTDGIRELRMRKPGEQSWVKIPTGMPLKHFIAQGYVLLDQEDEDERP